MNLVQAPSLGRFAEGRLASLGASREQSVGGRRELPESARCIIGSDPHRVRVEMEVGLLELPGLVVLEQADRSMRAFGLQENGDVDNVLVSVAWRHDARGMRGDALAMGLGGHPELCIEPLRGKLESAVAQIPEVEAELTRLNRDYEEHKSKYKELVDRREQASISRERNIRTDQIKFRILDPPRVPGSPTGPSRTLLLAVSLVGGIGAGVVFALLLGHFSDAVSDPDQLRQSFGLPILGIVSTMDSFKNHSLRVARSSGFFAGIAMLFVVFAGLVIVERQSGLSNLRSNAHVIAAYKGVGEASGRLKTVIAELIERI